MSQILEAVKKANPIGVRPGDEGKPELSMSELLNGMAYADMQSGNHPEAREA